MGDQNLAIKKRKQGSGDFSETWSATNPVALNSMNVSSAKFYVISRINEGSPTRTNRTVSDGYYRDFYYPVSLW